MPCVISRQEKMDALSSNRIKPFGNFSTRKKGLVRVNICLSQATGTYHLNGRRGDIFVDICLYESLIRTFIAHRSLIQSCIGCTVLETVHELICLSRRKADELRTFIKTQSRTLLGCRSVACLCTSIVCVSRTLLLVHPSLSCINVSYTRGIYKVLTVAGPTILFIQAKRHASFPFLPIRCAS